jgi:uracil-DNA glycosylase
VAGGFNMFQYDQYVSTVQKICWHPRDWNMIVETTNQTFSQELLANAKKLLKIIAFVLRSGE